MNTITSDSLSMMWIVLAALFLLSFSTISQAESNELGHAGMVSFSRGTVAASHDSKPPRLLGKDAKVYEGDNIQTSERSFVIIDFVDGTKITIRPNSNFTVEQFSTDKSSKQAKLALHEGGIRTSSSESVSSNPDDFQITTPTTTVKAQQADYSVRVCKGQECQKTNDKLKKGSAKAKQSVIARIVEIKGIVSAESAKDISQEARTLTLGAPLYNADKLTSEQDSFAVLVFKDAGRITIEPDSVFSITDYHLDEQGVQDKAFYKLVSGGMRVLTGSIGKENKADFEVNTLVATIGIRGTGFDLVERGEGLYSKVWQGTITQTNETGTIELSTPSINHIKDSYAIPEPVDALPAETFSTENEAPRPDEVDVSNEPELFDAVSMDSATEGTYVDVHDGHVRVSDNNDDADYVDLGSNESSYSNESGESVRLETSPEFMAQDPYPMPSEGFSENTAELGSYSLLQSSYEVDSSSEVFQCECAQ